MEFDVTDFVTEYGPDYQMVRFSACEAETPNAGIRTWGAALNRAERMSELSEAQCDALRDHFREYGAWDAEAIAEWTWVDLQAMLLQEVAAEYREHYEDGSEADGRLTEHEGRWTFYVGA